MNTDTTIEKMSTAYQEIILIDQHYFNSLIDDILSAQHSIDMEVYIFSEDSIAQEVAKALIKAAHKGVKIRILVDGFGTRNWNQIQTSLEEAGIETNIYHPVIGSIFTKPLGDKWLNKILHYIVNMNSRNHRKTCVIDKKNCLYWQC